MKAHGSSDSLAFRNAIKQAMDAAGTDMAGELEQSLQSMKEIGND